MNLEKTRIWVEPKSNDCRKNQLKHHVQDIVFELKVAVKLIKYIKAVIFIFERRLIRPLRKVMPIIPFTPLLLVGYPI
jgi:hypothetical protein